MNSKPARKLKLLMLTSRFPYPLEKGDKLRAFHQIRTLQKYFDIYLVSITDYAVHKSELEVIRPLVKELHIVRITPVQRLKSIVQSIFSELPFQISYFYSKEIKEYIDTVVDSIQPDHIYCQLARMAEYIKDSTIPKTLDYMDAFGIGMQRRANVVKFPYSIFYRKEAFRMVKYEKTIFNFFNNHIIISNQDKAQLEFAGSQNIKVVPNGIDTDYFNFNPTEKKYDIAFIGNMGYLPNIEAAEYLVNIILRLLPSDVKVLIAGARPDKRVKRLASAQVTIKGWSKDIRTAYAESKIFVAPLWSGTGQQNKILEAMSMGVPCITTSLVNNAILAKENTEILIADDEKIFSEKIILILKDVQLYHQISTSGRDFVKQNYSWEHYSQLLSTIFAPSK